MGLLKRLPGGFGCRNPDRSGGRGRRHLESCPGCRERQERERQFLQRLRAAAVPEPSGDLAARLLARTEQLAAELPAAAPPALPAVPVNVRPATFTSSADLPPEQAGKATAALMRADAGTPAGAPDPAGMPGRMERGLSRIRQFLAP